MNEASAMRHAPHPMAGRCHEHTSLNVNGVEHCVEIDADTSLLDLLRESLRLTGTKNGCGEGRCGTCTVIVNGKAVRSCVYPARRAAGAHIQTVEGLAQCDELHPLQQAFIQAGAVQCGFCTPGMLMTAKALLDRCPHPSRETILKAFKGNLCRCTGYTTIIEAIESVSSPGALPQTPAARGSPVGSSTTRPDAQEKVTGKAIFAADLWSTDMVHVKVLRAGYPHARLVRLDTRRAAGAPGVLAVCSSRDVPGSKTHGLLRQDWPVFVEDEIAYIGDALAMVVAESERQAREALGLIEVEYEPLPIIDCAEAGASPLAPRAHPRVPDGNILLHVALERGDLEAAFDGAAFVVENEYRTPAVEHAFLEPEASVACWADDGTLVVYCGSQIPFEDRRQVAACLSLPQDKVRVIQTAVGGAFGGKEDISAQIHAALATLVTGRPAKLVFTRQESMRVHPKRHATVIHLKTAADRQGRLLGVEARLVGDTGAYASVGEPVMTRAATHVSGPYHLPAARIDCKAVHTNNPPAGAFRGFGATQAHFASEIQMDILARKAGLSPFEIRRRNALRVGATTVAGQVLREGVGLLQTIDAVEQVMTNIQETERHLALPSGVRRGWGVASAFKNIGLGGGLPDSAGARVDLRPDGRLQVRSGAAEVGQGLVTILAQIAAEELGLSPAKVDVLLADTAETPDGGPTTASRQTFITGNAVRHAAIALRELLAGVFAERWDTLPDQVIFHDGWLSDPVGQTMTLEDAGDIAHSEGRHPSASYTYSPPPTVSLGQAGDSHFGYSYATQAAQVEIQADGQIRVLRVIAAHDVGKAINPRATEGQIHGGIMMGIGQALLEELIFDQGRLITDSFSSYRIPRIDWTPQITTILIEAPLSSGPYGAKGIGEITSIPTAAAIANAVFDATGIRFTHIPIRGAQLLQAF